MSKESESKLPSELNENWGSNYMMDGFWYDMEYGNGLKENPPANPVPQPSTSGLAQLPDGLIQAGDFEEVLAGVEQEQEGGMDLEGLGIVAKTAPNVDRSDTGIIDHSWLSDAYQDPARLPDKPVDNGIPDLQEAWGDRTDGITRVDLYDRAAISYEDALQHEEDDDPLHRDKLAKLVRMAMRKSAAGTSMTLIKKALIDQLGPEVAVQIRNPVRAIEAEHGLAGNVYIRASAYPRLQHGKWTKELKKAAKGCRYLVAAEGEDCESCATALGLQVVASPNEIEWSKELDRRAAELRATRQEPKTASNSPRDRLRGWYLGASRQVRLDIETTKVRHTTPSDMVTAAEATQAVADFKVPHRVVLSLTQRWKKADVQKAVEKVGAMVQAHLVTPEEAQKLLESKAHPREILKAAARIALTVKKAAYSGGEPETQDEGITKEAAWDGLRVAEAKVTEFEEEMRRRNASDDTKQRVRLIQAQINAGMKGKRLAAFIRKALPTRQDAFAAQPLLAPILKKTGALNPKAPETKQYEDATFTRHQASSPEIAVPVREIRKAARWVRQQMTEGTAGTELDQLIQLRLDPKVRAASEGVITEARQEHEGLSGHLYVEAAAYASPEGMAGCDEGALKHRANGVQFVKSMERCDGCVFKNADSVCQKYNKELVDEIQTEDREAFRRQVLASHEMTDQEQLAAMFSVGAEATESAMEFDLHNAALDDVDTEAPAHEALDGIFFGGFEVG
jgi:hypothetical protein